MNHFDAVIIGSGQAAPSLAVGLANRGQSVALIEGDKLGGTCVNSGCTPTKTLRKSARFAHMVRRAADFGVSSGEVTVDFPAAMARMRERVDTARRGGRHTVKRTKGVEAIHGWGSLAGFDENGRFIINVGESKFSADKVFLNTGTRSFTPPVPGLENIDALDNASLLALDELPDHLIIVGGSYIGLEVRFSAASAARSRWYTVPTVWPNARMRDVSAIIADFFQDEGVTLHLNAIIARVGSSMRGVLMTLEDGTEIAGSHILFATGRAPNTDRLNLAAVGLETDLRGYVPTDAKLRTGAQPLGAGDVNRRGAFTHTSYHDHEIVLADLDGVKDLYQWKDADQRPTTYAMFTDPPLGARRPFRTEARKLAAEGRNILIADMRVADISRAKEESETTGLIRIIVDGDSEAILGATVFGISNT